MADDTPKTHDLDDLLAVMARLRDPDTGCPWDVKQSFETIAPYTIEEAYEVGRARRPPPSGRLSRPDGERG